MSRGAPSERKLAEAGAIHASPKIPADCRHCGVCCFSDSRMYIRVNGADWARLGPDAVRLARFVGHRAFMRMRAGHCRALECRTLRGGVIDYFCTIYDRRPQLCRDLVRGSPACEAEVLRKQPAVAARPPPRAI